MPIVGGQSYPGPTVMGSPDAPQGAQVAPIPAQTPPDILAGDVLKEFTAANLAHPLIAAVLPTFDAGDLLMEFTAGDLV